MAWLDTIITIIVIGVVLGIFYKALKEPIDLVGGWIKRLLGGARDKISEIDYGGEGNTIIRYG